MDHRGFLGQRWTHVITHLSKPKECTAPGVNPNVNRGLGWFRGGRGGSQNLTNAPLVGLLLMGEAVHVRGPQACGKLCTFPSILLRTLNCSKASLINAF